MLLIISIIVTGSPKSADDGPAAVAQWYSDNKDAAEIGSFIGVVAGALPDLLRGVPAQGPRARSRADARGSCRLIGIAIVAIGAAIDGMLMFAAAEAVDDIPAPEIQTIQAIWDNDFLPFILGVLVFNWSVGLAVLRSGALPKWMGWWAIVFGVISLAGPIGFVGALGAALWIIIASILLSMRASGPAPAQPSATTAP